MTPLAHIGAVPVEELVPLLLVGAPALLVALRALATTGERIAMTETAPSHPPVPHLTDRATQ